MSAIKLPDGRSTLIVILTQQARKSLVLLWWHRQTKQGNWVLFHWNMELMRRTCPGFIDHVRYFLNSSIVIIASKIKQDTKWSHSLSSIRRPISNGQRQKRGSFTNLRVLNLAKRSSDWSISFATKRTTMKAYLQQGPWRLVHFRWEEWCLHWKRGIVH